MKGKITFLLLFIIGTFNIQSQNILEENDLELGVRISTSVRSWPNIISLNARMHLDVGAVEAIISPWSDRFVITGLYAGHDTDFIKKKYSGALEGFSYFLGLGGHAGFSNTYFLSGVDVQLGLEYKIPKLPLKVSTDFKPAFHLTNPETINKLEWQGGASIRFVL